MRSMGKKIYAKQILASLEEYFTDDVMEKLDAIARETLHMDEFIKQCETFDSITCNHSLIFLRNLRTKRTYRKLWKT